MKMKQVPGTLAGRPLIDLQMKNIDTSSLSLYVKNPVFLHKACLFPLLLQSPTQRPPLISRECLLINFLLPLSDGVQWFPPQRLAMWREFWSLQALKAMWSNGWLRGLDRCAAAYCGSSGPWLVSSSVSLVSERIERQLKEIKVAFQGAAFTVGVCKLQFNCTENPLVSLIL